MNSLSKTLLLSILLLSVIPFGSFAQDKSVKKTPFLTHLLSSKKEITSINNINSKELFNINIFNRIFINKNLIKTDSGLYLNFDGTGRVYQAKEKSNDSIEFIRIDSTFVFGYNNNAINFSYKNILYSFGGYGIWHNNGQLRYYNSISNEWFIEKIDQKFNTNDLVYHIATDNSHQNNPAIYYITTPTKDEEGFNKEELDFEIIKYDIKAKKNKKLGVVNKEFVLRPHKNIDLPSLHGVLINDIKDHYLFNFEENKAYKLTSKKLIGLLENTNLYNTFEENGKIYYTIYPDTTLHGTNISMEDFSKEYLIIYEDDRLVLKYWWLILIGLLSLSLVLYRLILKSRGKEIRKKKIKNIMTKIK